MKRHEILSTNAPAATVLIRLLVGAVFVSEGIQKFLYPEALGPGRFEAIGFVAPELWATLVGSVEIIAGALVLVGFLTRPAALALATIMVVAIVTTKIPILLGRDLGPFSVRSLDTYGFWSMAHEARTDWAMLLGSLFLVVVGAGARSVDARITGQIHRGYLILAGFHRTDTDEQLEWMADKIIGLRLFADADDKMNLSLADIGGGLLVVSQFTLYGDTRKGRRPSFIDAAPPEIAIPLYEKFVGMLRQRAPGAVETGEFGAMMDVELVNDGPVTLVIER